MINVIFYSLLALAILLTPSYGSDNITIGRMNVKIWPEYDDTGVLVIYDGRFTDSALFPLKARFLIPTGSVVSDACSVSPRGEHFCQLYEISSGKEFDEITITLPYPNFYLSFHTPSLGSEKQKSFTYTIKATYPVDTMEVDIQQPLRAERFVVSPPARAELIRGFTHFLYEIKNVKEGDTREFKISYYKEDQKPSVDIKYSPPMMKGADTGKGSPYSTQRMVRILLYGGFFTGLLVLGIIIAWFVRSKKAS